MNQHSIQPALEAFQQGRYQQAAALLQRQLQADPSNAPALHLLGIVRAHLGELDAASALLDRVIDLVPRAASAHMDRGNVALSLGQIELAMRAYRRAIEIDPELADAYLNLGHALRQSGDTVGAINYYEKSVDLQNQSVNAWFALGDAHFTLGDFTGALTAYTRTLALQPKHIDAMLNRGTALFNLNRHADAAACFRQVLLIIPDHAEALAKYGNAKIQLGEFEESVQTLTRAVSIRPDEADWLTWKGHALQGLKRYEEALACYEQALDHMPDHPWALEGVAVALHELGRFEEALLWHEKTIARSPNHASCYLNRGNTRRDLKQNESSLADFQRALELDPSYANAEFNQAVMLLKLERWREAWPLYEARWRYQQAPDPSTQPRGLPRWDGQTPLANKKILLSHEQGLGDTIQIVRYAKSVADMGAEVWLWVPKALERLLGNVAGVTGTINTDQSVTSLGFNFYCPIMSLLGFFGATPNQIPFSTEPYLQVENSLVNHWRTRLALKSGKPIVGIMWQGGTNRFIPGRSLSLEQLDPLLKYQLTFLSLQKDLSAGELECTLGRNIIHVGEDQNDFADAAALIELCDLVISIDTSIAHLAGGLGKETWLLLPYLADWRWLENRSNAIWYPNVKLFRQPRREDWAGVVEMIETNLQQRFEIP